MNETNHVIVIDAGAAGMLTTVAAAGEGAEVELWEQNEKPGKELPITGKGRYNVANTCDMEELLGSVVNNSKFLYSSSCGFTNQDIMDLLKQAGLRLKMERGNRVFPQSDKSSDVISILSGLIRQAGIEVRLSQKADGLTVEGGVRKGVRYGGRIQAVDHVIMATSGLSYPATRSTGDGLKWALNSGHRLTELSLVLVPFGVKETEAVKELQDLSLKSVEAAVCDRKRELCREFGEMPFTHFGVSGPVFLSASSFCARTMRKKHLRLVIGLKPVLSWRQLNERILEDFSDSRSKQFKNTLNHPYPAKLIPVTVAHSGVGPDKRVNEVTREERRGLAGATKSLEFTLTRLRGYKEAVIARGGMSVKDVDPSTMKSKKIRGLCFAGEVLDPDVVAGSLNLQVAWSAGWAAGKVVTSQRRGYRDFLARQNT